MRLPGLEPVLDLCNFSSSSSSGYRTPVHSQSALGCWAAQTRGPSVAVHYRVPGGLARQLSERAVKGPNRLQAISDCTQQTLGGWLGCRIRSYPDSAQTTASPRARLSSAPWSASPGYRAAPRHPGRAEGAAAGRPGCPPSRSRPEIRVSTDPVDGHIFTLPQPYLPLSG